MFKLNHSKCAIYRGSGGSTSTTDQATIDQVAEDAATATTKAAEAASSASSAASSASSASSSATSASSSASTATTKASEASTSATNAASSASAASSSATSAASSATSASGSATNAASEAAAALSSKALALDAQTAAETAESNASDHADDAVKAAYGAEDVLQTLSDSSTLYSARHYAAKVEQFDSNASDSADAAAASASAASTSETNAATSETNAAASAAAAEATFDLFDDAYLGAKASDPSVDNDGDALADGALYFDTTNDVMKVYDLASTTWYQLTPTVSNQTNINTVAGISSDVSSVAAIDSDVTTVAGIDTDVTDVAAIDSNVTTVAGISSDVSTVAGISANVTTVAGIDTEVTAVAGNASNINQVASDTAVINSASANATSAAASATAAASSATDAATSAAQANAVVQGEAAVRHSIRPSLLLDFANSKTLDPRIDFTRSSTATYYDGKTFAKAEENLFTYSQDFSEWNATRSVVVDNDTTAPDGTSTAASLNQASGQTVIGYVTTSVYSVSTDTHVFSVYAKENGKDFLLLREEHSDGAASNTWFDLVNGAVETTDANHTASIVDVGNGWYRCIIEFSPRAAVLDTIYISVADTDGSTSVADDGNGIYIWGAQVEQRDSVTAYTPTTTQPITNYIPVLQTAASGAARFDHDPVTGESKGLLIEEQRTNLGTQSSYLAGSISEYNSVRTTQLQNQIIAPDGTLTGDKLIATTDGSTHRLDQSARSMFSVSTTYTVSCYAKAGEYEGITLTITGSSNYVNGVYFNLTTGSSGVMGGSYTSTMEDVGNGWYRCSVTRTTPSSIAASDNKWILGIVDSGSNISFDGDGFSGVYVWGAQVEAGAFPTSYIPTSGSQVTRSADAASMTGTNFSDWYRQDEGTVYVAGGRPENTSYRRLVAIGDTSGGTNTNEIAIYPLVGTTNIGSSYRVNGSTVANFSNPTTITDTGEQIKYAISYKVNDFAASADGGTALTDTVGSIGNGFTKLFIGAGNEGYPDRYANQCVSKIAYYPTRLTNAEIVALTEA
jgi:hypothetical protein